jgi:diguanylate cyclase (GGDEF)-like protein
LGEVKRVDRDDAPRTDAAIAPRFSSAPAGLSHPPIVMIDNVLRPAIYCRQGGKGNYIDKPMNAVSYPLIVMASAILYVGSSHLFLYLHRKDMREHLPFSLLCLSIALYDVFCIGLYNSHSVAQGIIWQNLQLQAGNFISVFVVLFVVAFTRQRKNRVILIILTWFALLLALSVLLNDRFTLSASRPSIKSVGFFGIAQATYYEGQLGLVYIVDILSEIAGYVYLLFLLRRHYSKTRDKNSYFILAGLAAYFLGVVNDTAVAAHLYSSLYLSEYSFLVVVLAGSYALLNDLLALYRSAEETKQNLERKVGERTNEIQTLNEELKKLAERDGLTGIYNRRFFDQYLEIEVRRAKNRFQFKTAALEAKHDMNFGLAIVDVDEFKKINDTLGHLFGDAALMAVVEEIRKCIFSRDVFCRYGGDEFVILFTRTSREGILLAAEKIRKSLEAHEFRLKEDAPAHRITISMGVVVFDDVPGISSDEILKLADDRLLAAKQGGRNKVVFE